MRIIESQHADSARLSHFHGKGANGRRAFTLVELLVVISIIAVLSALAAGAYFATVNRQSLNNTRASLQAVEKLMLQHWQQVVADAKKEDVPTPVRTWAGDSSRARVVWVKLRLMEAFPTTFGEIVNQETAFWPYAQNLIPAGRRKYMPQYRKQLSGTTPSGDEAQQSSACLLLALSVTRAGNALDRDALGSAYFRDTNDDRIEEIVDGWGNAIRFYRFPTGNAELQASNPQKQGKGAKFADPLDPDGLLFTWPAAGKSLFETNVHPIGAGPTHYIVPVLVSAGKDEQFGLDATMGVSDTAKASDNIYSFTLKQ